MLQVVRPDHAARRHTSGPWQPAVQVRGAGPGAQGEVATSDCLHHIVVKIGFKFILSGKHDEDFYDRTWQVIELGISMKEDVKSTSEPKETGQKNQHSFECFFGQEKGIEKDTAKP